MLTLGVVAQGCLCVPPVPSRDPRSSLHSSGGHWDDLSPALALQMSPGHEGVRGGLRHSRTVRPKSPERTEQAPSLRSSAGSPQAKRGTQLGPLASCGQPPESPGRPRRQPNPVRDCSEGVPKSEWFSNGSLGHYEQPSPGHRLTGRGGARGPQTTGKSLSMGVKLRDGPGKGAPWAHLCPDAPCVLLPSLHLLSSPAPSLTGAPDTLDQSAQGPRSGLISSVRP